MQSFHDGFRLVAGLSARYEERPPCHRRSRARHEQHCLQASSGISFVNGQGSESGSDLLGFAKGAAAEARHLAMQQRAEGRTGLELQ